MTDSNVEYTKEGIVHDVIDALANGVLTLDQFLDAAGHLKTRYISPEKLQLPGGVWVRELTAHQREMVIARGGTLVMYEVDGEQRQELDLGSGKGASSLIVSYALVTDETGSQRMFKKIDDPRIRKLSSHVIDTITREVRDLSGMTKESRDDIKNGSGNQTN